MTEREWQTSENPRDMASCLVNEHRVHRRKAGRRKLRLFGCASCRLLWDLLTDPRSRAAVEYAEELADGVADPARSAAVMEGAQRAALDVRDRVMASRRAAGVPLRIVEPEMAAAEHLPRVLYKRPDHSALAHWAMNAMIGYGHAEAHRQWRAALRDLACLLREIFGNPFRPAVRDRSWLTSEVVALARGAYDERAFDQLPILADALQDAGCDSAEILAHLRGPGPHARGCWAVDLVLAKE
jgi:hypothetical protein